MLLSLSKFVESFQLTFSTKDNREKLSRIYQLYLNRIKKTMK